MKDKKAHSQVCREDPPFFWSLHEFHHELSHHTSDPVKWQEKSYKKEEKVTHLSQVRKGRGKMEICFFS